MSFTHNINPVILDLGPVEIRYYGLVYVLGFVLVFLYFRYLIKSRKLKLSMEELYDLIFYNMLGVLIGSRLIHCIFWNPLYYLSEPWKFFYVWEGGMAFHGGILGVAIGTYLFWKKIDKRISFGKLGDYMSIPAIFILAIGRIVNFINGELPGTVTDVPWCVYFPGFDGCRHPQQLYNSAMRFGIFAWLLYLNATLKAKRWKDGFIMWNMVFWSGVGRFVIDFWRDDATFLYLTAGQYLSLILIIGGIYVFHKYYKKDCRDLFRSGSKR